jgi:hypothetical protein
MVCNSSKRSYEVAIAETALLEIVCIEIEADLWFFDNLIGWYSVTEDVVLPGRAGFVLTELEDSFSAGDEMKRSEVDMVLELFSWGYLELFFQEDRFLLLFEDGGLGCGLGFEGIWFFGLICSHWVLFGLHDDMFRWWYGYQWCLIDGFIVDLHVLDGKECISEASPFASLVNFPFIHLIIIIRRSEF